MAKATSLIILLVVGAVLGSPPRRFGAARKHRDASDPFIVGGEIVIGREFPGQVSVQYGHEHNCGGSIINANYILTAAHCADFDPSMLDILSGTNSLESGGTYHKVVEIHVHEKYDEYDSWHNDVAVMKVDPPFEFDADGNTAPVSLPEQDQDTAIGSNATVIGWGSLSYMGDSPTDLYKVSIQSWDHDDCNAAYQPFGKTVYPEQICADTPDGNKASCQGDSGGPLFVNKQVVGLVSWARGCGEKGYPTVYTRVSAYRDWIDSKVKA